MLPLRRGILDRTGDCDDAVSLFQNDLVEGWVREPNYRGTWQILWTCLVTTFLCTYTLLCLNVPASSDTWSDLLQRRLKAKHSVEAFHNSGYPEWTIRMAFFADMGGFVLHAADSQPFPLNAKQLHWLVVNKFSKQDRLSKLMSSIQVTYLVVDCIARTAQGLAITTLELNTLCIVVCSLMTAFAWLHKPVDIRTPYKIASPCTITEINGGRDWDTTPLDFIDENGPGWALNVQPFMGMPVIPDARPIQHIPNDRFPMNPYGAQEYCVCFGTLLFTGLHILGWNFSFPSATEKVLWRVSSLILFGVTAAFWIFETAASWVRLGRWRWLHLYLFNRRALEQFEHERQERAQRHVSSRKAIELPLPWEFWTIMPIAVIYGVARLYQIVEMFLQLRHLDTSTFAQVSWSTYLPHI
ncbi:hypothetical protein NLU13_3432 [Sarocladium strictum]|uniref:Uncharacterized protein n=1 Tax=Sarocladium strictum TaxID=5046 RepID=A0AA39GNU5_SARSR|nr:hypothetical protein NLU13_3432 [Sarocladium strictum]